MWHGPWTCWSKRCSLPSSELVFTLNIVVFIRGPDIIDTPVDINPLRHFCQWGLRCASHVMVSPKSNGSHFGLPPSFINEMTGLHGWQNWVCPMTYSHMPHPSHLSFWVPAWSQASLSTFCLRTPPKSSDRQNFGTTRGSIRYQFMPAGYKLGGLALSPFGMASSASICSSSGLHNTVALNF